MRSCLSNLQTALYIRRERASPRSKRMGRSRRLFACWTLCTPRDACCWSLRYRQKHQMSHPQRPDFLVGPREAAMSLVLGLRLFSHTAAPRYSHRSTRHMQEYHSSGTRCQRYRPMGIGFCRMPLTH
ncbi:hypothetical protein BDW75DRAFT_226155 [Aspergillus navahoensis]